MIEFEDGGGAYYFMNFNLDLYKAFVPFEKVRVILKRREPDKSYSDDDIRTFMSGFSHINHISYIARRASWRKNIFLEAADLRVTLTPIPRDSVTYKAILADRMAIMVRRDPNYVRFFTNAARECGPASADDKDEAEHVDPEPRALLVH